MSHPYSNISTSFKLQADYCTISTAPFNAYLLIKASQVILQDNEEAHLLQSIFSQWQHYSLDDLQ